MIGDIVTWLTLSTYKVYVKTSANTLTRCQQFSNNTQRPIMRPLKQGHPAICYIGFNT